MAVLGTLSGIAGGIKGLRLLYNSLAMSSSCRDIQWVMSSRQMDSVNVDAIFLRFSWGMVIALWSPSMVPSISVGDTERAPLAN